jgi:beta-lactamase regulating signal transducer with metallopeptidase domain
VSRAVACLLALTVAASVAVLLVGLLRTALRRIAGARAAYGLWLMPRHADALLKTQLAAEVATRPGPCALTYNPYASQKSTAPAV